MPILKITNSRLQRFQSFNRDNKKAISGGVEIFYSEFQNGSCYAQILGEKKKIIQTLSFHISEKRKLRLYSEQNALYLKFFVHRQLQRNKILILPESICQLVYFPAKIPVPTQVSPNSSIVAFRCEIDFLLSLSDDVPKVLDYINSKQKQDITAIVSPFYPTSQEFRMLIEDIMNVDIMDSYSRHLEMKAYFYKFLFKTRRCFKSLGAIQKEQDKERSKFLEIKWYIQNNLDADLNLKALIKRFYTSISSLNSLFEKYAATSLPRFVRKKRMEKAKELLRETKNEISQIAYDVGYDSNTSFTKAFKKYTSLSPNDYRVQQRLNQFR